MRSWRARDLGRKVENGEPGIPHPARWACLFGRRRDVWRDTEGDVGEEGSRGRKESDSVGHELPADPWGREEYPGGNGRGRKGGSEDAGYLRARRAFPERSFARPWAGSHGNRYRHQHSLALRSLRGEHASRKRQGRRFVSQREVRRPARRI